MLENEWVKLDTDALDQYSSITIRGTEFQVHLSHYEIPDAMRCGWGPGGKTLTIEFRYLGSSESVQRLNTGRMTFYLGKNSQRVHRIDVDAEIPQQAGGESVEIANIIRAAIKELPGGRSGVHTGNYAVASKAIAEHSDLLVK